MYNAIYIISCGVGELSIIILKSFIIIYFSKILFYESLINLNLLNFSNQYSFKILIGKRFKQYSIFKKTVHKLIYISYNKYFNLSKLKSGDINFFSRINNEINYYNINTLNYKIYPCITTFISYFCRLSWFLTIRFNISTIIFITYFNSTNLLKINKNFLNKIIIYYMINNNFIGILSSVNEYIIFCITENLNYITEHIYNWHM